VLYFEFVWLFLGVLGGNYVVSFLKVRARKRTTHWLRIRI